MNEYRQSCTKLHPRNPIQLAKLENPTITGLRKLARMSLYPFDEEYYPVPDYYVKNVHSKREPNYISSHFLEETDENRLNLELVTNKILSLAELGSSEQQCQIMEGGIGGKRVGHQPVPFQSSVDNRNNRNRPITGLRYDEIDFAARRYNPSLGLPPVKPDTVALLR